jgi:glycosyltransferase involved in cell wall biosynthesis
VFFRRAIRRAARHAGVLICVSEATATRLQASCEVRVPVVVAPHGVDHQRFTATEPSAGADAAILGDAGIPTDRPLVVFVGTLEPRKGVATLVAAFDQVAEHHVDAVLVLAGQMGWGLAETERALAAARHRDRIIETGYLADTAVPALLRRAAVVAYPSLDEGFGLPALEALACGAALVTTEGTAMAEVAGSAARLVPPDDAGALADALRAALEESPQSAGAGQRRALGLARAAGYTWEASLQRHLAAYELARAGSQ